MNPLTLFTVGHSTLSAAAFLELLQSHSIETLADIRRFPGSRRYPHFNKFALSSFLEKNGIAYVHFPEVGGRRKARKVSPHTLLRNTQFRGYADHMGTAEFREGLERLLTVSDRSRTAVMCAEGWWRRCHRMLLSDVLVARGVHVRHITGKGKSEPHAMTEGARVRDGAILYAAAEEPRQPELKL